MSNLSELTAAMAETYKVQENKIAELERRILALEMKNADILDAIANHFKADGQFRLKKSVIAGRCTAMRCIKPDNGSGFCDRHEPLSRIASETRGIKFPVPSPDSVDIDNLWGDKSLKMRGLLKEVREYLADNPDLKYFPLESICHDLYRRIYFDPDKPHRRKIPLPCHVPAISDQKDLRSLVDQVLDALGWCCIIGNRGTYPAEYAAPTHSITALHLQAESVRRDAESSKAQPQLKDLYHDLCCNINRERSDAVRGYNQWLKKQKEI